MPLPVTPVGIEQWEEAIVSALSRPPCCRTQDERLAAIARFDLEVTGKEWEALIQRAIAPHKRGEIPESAR